jgi:hypothetical protein
MIPLSVYNLICFSAIAVMMTSAKETTTFQPAIFDTDSKAIGIDNRCTASISPDESDFPFGTVPVNRRVKGIGGIIQTGIREGTMKLDIPDDQGVHHTIYLPNSYYVPQSSQRLLSPQHWAQKAKDNKPLPRGTWSATYDDSVVLWWHQRKYQLTLPLNPNGDNVATIYSNPGYKKFEAFCAQCQADGIDDDDPVIADPNIVSEDESYSDFDDESISDASIEQQSLDSQSATPNLHSKLLHQGLHTQGHGQHTQGRREDALDSDFNLNGPDNEDAPAVIEDEETYEETNLPATPAEFLKMHQRFGHLPPDKIRIMARQGLIPSKFAKCEIPMCTACLFGKATRRPWRTKPTTKKTSSKTMNAPGQVVSVDQLISSTPGLIAQLKGWMTKKRYTTATIFVDQYSGLSYVHLQKSTYADETLQAKHAFERYATRHGVKVRHYHADNGRFAENLWMTDIQRQGQTISFCGVDAHFQNGVAERRIRELQDQARTMLIHANRRWPTAITAHLWPYALRTANDIYNATPNLQHKRHRTPLELFTGSPTAPNPKHLKTFGCPVYVYDRSDKWSERARVGIYLGQSPAHARTVALVLDLKTGYVSPQFHVKWDNQFETVRGKLGNQAPPSLWQQRAGFIKVIKTSEGANPTATTLPRNAIPASSSEQPAHPTPELEGDHPHEPPSNIESPPPSSPSQPEQRSEQPSTQEPNQESNQEPNQQPSRRSLRRKAQSRYEREGIWATEAIESLWAAQALCYPFEETMDALNIVAYETLVELDFYEEEACPITAFAASADPDTMYLHEAMKQPDKKQFIEAMQKEIEAHEKRGHWEVISKSKVPDDMPILPAVWAMRRKRRIATRQVYKWKARINIDGSKQVRGVNYWDTFAPVASWSSIRLLLVMSLINNWHTKQIDYVQAYTQADVECDMYMKIPKGFEVPDSDEEQVLRIKKNIYGSKQAGRVWNNHLTSKLIEIGFKQSDVDPCVYYRGKSVYVLYTDDSLLAGPDQQELDQIIQDMKDAELDLTVEGDIGDFLGVKIERQENGSFILSQPHLIESTLKDLRLLPKDQDANAQFEQSKPKSTPAAVSKPLHAYPNSKPFDDHFDYRSVIGKLNYVEKCTRPDISVAVHQCARFQADPKVEHGNALKWLGRYLLGTKDKGMVYHPTEQSFDCFVDADFAGNWDKDTAEFDTDTARSRTGYVITYAGCPITWTSKLQTEIALSTTESEYLALSTCLRETIPLIDLTREFKARGLQLQATQPTIHCKIFDDNSGAVELANVPKMRPRTKHINVKYHHFREKVKQGLISIHQIPREQQIADLLTHPVNETTLIKFRKAIMGW